MVHQTVGKTVSNRNPHQRMRNRQRIQTAVRPKHLRKEQSAHQRQARQGQIRQMQQRKQHRTDYDRSPSPKQLLEAYIEI